MFTNLSTMELNLLRSAVRGARDCIEAVSGRCTDPTDDGREVISDEATPPCVKLVDMVYLLNNVAVLLNEEEERREAVNA